MYELYVGARASARHLFDSLDHHLAVRGILEGTVTARVFADHPNTSEWSAIMKRLLSL